MCVRFQAQKDTTATARSPRRSHIGALNTFETRTHPQTPSPLSSATHSITQITQHCPLLIVLLLNKMSLSLHTRSWIVFHSLHHPTRRGRQRHSQPSLSLSHLAHTAHTKGCNTQITSTTPLLCRLLPPASFTQPPGLFSHRQMCSFSLHHSHTHVGSTHTHTQHTHPRKYLQAGAPHSLGKSIASRIKKRARDPPPLLPFPHRISLDLRAARLREHRLPRREVAIRRRHLRNLARRPPIRPIRRRDQLLYHRAGREVARRERAQAVANLIAEVALVGRHDGRWPRGKGQVGQHQIHFR